MKKKKKTSSLKNRELQKCFNQAERGLAKTAHRSNKQHIAQIRTTASLRPSFFDAGPVALTSGNFQPVRKWSNETFDNLTKG